MVQFRQLKFTVNFKTITHICQLVSLYPGSLKNDTKKVSGVLKWQRGAVTEHRYDTCQLEIKLPSSDRTDAETRVKSSHPGFPRRITPGQVMTSSTGMRLKIMSPRPWPEWFLLISGDPLHHRHHPPDVVWMPPLWNRPRICQRPLSLWAEWPRLGHVLRHPNVPWLDHKGSVVICQG